MTKPNLKLIDTSTGEIVQQEPTCPSCAFLQDQLDGVERELRAWRFRYANLARDKEQEARDHRLWPEALDLFEQWKLECKHPRSEWTPDRFFAIMPLLKRYGYETCSRAIAGIAYDPYTRVRRNGTAQRFDEWERVFKDAGNLERFANCAPKGWQLPE